MSDGHINAFDSAGNFLGPLADANGNLLIGTDGLWGLIFRGESQLFFAAGANGYADGLFGVISPIEH